MGVNEMTLKYLWACAMTSARAFMFTMVASLCRLCRTTLLPKHAVNLFGHAAVKTQLSSRTEDLLGIRVAENDGLPQHICERCKRRVETLERAVADLEGFRSQARDSYDLLLLTRAPLKRTKESSASIGVSPDTIRARPPPKKHLSQRQLTFEHGRLTVHNNSCCCIYKYTNK